MWFKAPLLALVWVALIASTYRAEDQSVPLDRVLVPDAEGNWMLVRAHCTSCHSTQIFKNLRLSRNAWQDAIRRMQVEEGLWSLGESEPKILDYLETYFGPERQSPKPRSRRIPLTPSIRSTSK